MATSSHEWAESHPETPEEFRVLHRFLMVTATILFIWVVAVGSLLMPFLIFKYGGQ